MQTAQNPPTNCSTASNTASWGNRYGYTVVLISFLLVGFLGTLHRINPVLDMVREHAQQQPVAVKASSAASTTVQQRQRNDQRNETPQNSVGTSNAHESQTVNTKRLTTENPTSNIAGSPQSTENNIGDEQAVAEEKPMNIVLLYADDWSYSTLGVVHKPHSADATTRNSNAYVKTPHLDALADTGMLFTHNCVVTSVCMQSRATLYTGQYSSRHETYYAWRNITMYEPEKWNETLYVNMLRHGYEVGFFGKYHHLEPPPLPTFSQSILYQQSHYRTLFGITKHITQWNEDHGLDFLERRPQDKPFFLTLSFFATHAEDGNEEQYRPMPHSTKWYNATESVPLPRTMTDSHWENLPYFFNEGNMGRQRYHNRYDTPEDYQTMMKRTYRMASEVDDVCGKIIAKLKEQGVYDNTLIIFTTDNGNSHGQHGLSEKWTPYEESLRVPLIIKDPRMPHSKLGTRNDDFTLNLDLAPTILSAAGALVPDGMQGRDMSDLYRKDQPDWRQEFIYEYFDDLAGIPNSLALVRKDSKYIRWTDFNYTQLFQMKEDPWEEFDKYNATDAVMLELLDQRLNELRQAAMTGQSM